MMFLTACMYHISIFIPYRSIQWKKTNQKELNLEVVELGSWAPQRCFTTSVLQPGDRDAVAGVGLQAAG